MNSGARVFRGKNSVLEIPRARGGSHIPLPSLRGWVRCLKKGDVILADILDAAATETVLADVFAPWIQALGIRVEETGPDGGRFRLPGGDEVCRSGGDGPPVMCGQALASAADTVSVLSLCAANGRFRNCTTVDLTTHFMRPVIGADAILSTEILSNGRRMAVVRVTAAADGSSKPAASATLAFAYLED